MKIVELEQNTPEWHEWRSGVIGASDVPDLMADRWAQLYAKKAGTDLKIDNVHTRRGHELEPNARRWAEEKFETVFQPICVQHQKDTFLAASLDGYDPVNEVVLEIKCPLVLPQTIKSHKEFQRYWTQVQAQLLCSGAKFAYLVYYKEGGQLVEKIERDEKFMQQIEKKASEFFDKHLKPKVAPQDPYKDLNDNPDAVQIASEFEELDRRFKEMKELHDAKKKELLEISQGENIRVGNVISYSTKPRETFDYAKMIEDFKIVKDDYKKVGKPSITVKVV